MHRMFGTALLAAIAVLCLGRSAGAQTATTTASTAAATTSAATGPTTEAAILWPLPPRGGAAAKVDQKAIDKLVAQLGDDKWKTREQASEELSKVGRPALSALKKAVASSDPEVARRATELLRKIHVGVTADTPKEVAPLLEQYRDADQNQKQVILSRLTDLPLPYAPYLLGLYYAESDAGIRARLMLNDGRLAQQIACMMAIAGDFDGIEELLKTAAENDLSWAPPRYAGFLARQGKLPATIKRYEDGNANNRLMILAWLHRANGDDKAALKVLDTLRGATGDLRQIILIDQQDWKRLAEITPKPAINTQYADGRTRADTDAFALRAIYCRLAGHDADARAALDDVLTLAGDPQFEGWFACMTILLLNDRIPDGLDALKTRNPELAIELLTTQMRFDEALACVEKALAAADENRTARLGPLQAMILARLGEKDKSDALINEYAKKCKIGSKYSLEHLYNTLVNAGQSDRAVAALGEAVTACKDDPNAQLALLSSCSESAGSLWRDAPQALGQDPTARLATLLKLMGNKLTPAELAALVDESLQAAARLDTARREVLLSSLFHFCGNAGRVDLKAKVADACQVSSPYFERQLAGDYRRAGRWRQAASRYARVFDRSPSPDLMLLEGYCRLRGGDEVQGRGLMELAGLCVVNANSYYSYLQALSELGPEKAFRQECVLFLRTSTLDDNGNIRGQFGAFLAGKDHLKAAFYNECQRINCLRSNSFFTDHRAYLLLPQGVHLPRLRHFLENKEFDKALVEMDLLLQGMPGGNESLILTVAALDRAGRKADADKLHKRYCEIYRPQCEKFPRAVMPRNAVAWVSARCRRNLDEALTLAGQAVELEKEHAGILDTLAEVHFQLGHREQAVKLMQQAIDLDAKQKGPMAKYLAGQLERMKTKPPTTDPPPWP